MSTVQKVRISLTGHGKGKVEIDGKEFPAVAVQMRARAGSLNRVALIVHAKEVEIEGEFEVTTLAERAKRVEVIK